MRFHLGLLLLVVLVLDAAKAQLTGINVPKPACVPCQPKEPISRINCNCAQLTTISIPTIPGVNNCLNILVALCKPANSGATIQDFLGALAGVTKCFVKLTSINANYTDISKVKTPDGKSGQRLLEQLLGGVGKLVDNLLAGLLGTGGDGGLLGRILG